MPDKNFIPFSFEGKGGELPNVTPGVHSINISDFELETCLTVIVFPFANFQDIEYSKQQIIEYGILLDRYELVSLTCGNLAIRMPTGEVLITPSGMAYDKMVEEVWEEQVEEEIHLLITILK